MSFLDDTRASYDAIAVAYTAQFGTAPTDNPLDRALLGAFAQLVRDKGPVADVGCGPGSAAGHLHALGVDVFGIDLSPGMLAVAREAHPGIRFVEGSMTALDLPDGELAGVVAHYSTIHVPDDVLPAVLAEFHRVLAPGGYAWLAFQVGDEPKHYAEGFGHAVDLTFHRRRPEQVAKLLDAAGLPVQSVTVREPLEAEPTPQAFLTAHRPRC